MSFCSRTEVSVQWQHGINPPLKRGTSQASCDGTPPPPTHPWKDWESCDWVIALRLKTFLVFTFLYFFLVLIFRFFSGYFSQVNKLTIARCRPNLSPWFLEFKSTWCSTASILSGSRPFPLHTSKTMTSVFKLTQTKFEYSYKNALYRIREVASCIWLNYYCVHCRITSKQ